MNPQPTDTFSAPARRASCPLGLIRLVLYGYTLLCAFLTFVLAAVVISTLSMDFESYNDATGELLASSLIALIALIPLHGVFHRTRPDHIISSTMVELGVISFLWVLFLAGAAATAHDYANLRCFRSNLCGQSRALQAFAWLTFGGLSGLIGLIAATAGQARNAGRQGVWRADFGNNAGERSTPLPAGNRGAGEKTVGQGAPAQGAGVA